MTKIKADENQTPTEIENMYVEAVLDGDEEVSVEITEAQAEKMDLEKNDE